MCPSAKDVSRVEIKEMEWKRSKRLDSKYFNSCMERKSYRIQVFGKNKRIILDVYASCIVP